MLQLARLAPDPLATLDEDYAAGVVRLAWAIERKTRERILVCAAVELLPREVPAPVLRAERSMTVSRRFFLYAHDVVVPARRGVAWFEDASRGLALRPDPNGTFGDAADPNVPRFIVGPFAQEPAGPSILTATKVVPFAADWQTSTRVRHLVTETDPFRDWTSDERASAVAWFKTDVHVDLGGFPEYAGSVHLLAPNPIFRSLFVRHERDAQGRSALLVAITPRAGRSVSGLDLLIEDKRATGTGVLARITLEQPLVRVELPHYAEEIRPRVIDPRRGLLFDGHFRMFDVGFNMTVELATSVRRVEPTGPADAYEVPLVGGFKTASRVGAMSDRRAASAFLFGASVERTRRERGAAQQKWFRDRAPDAVKALRDLVGPAKGSVFVCDPYFGGDDLLRVILAIADPETEVRILTSAMHLRRRRDVGTEGDHLARRIEEARGAPPVNPIDVHVMPGHEPSMHDRFLVAAERMWMLGASINNFGERGTLMVWVPDPRPVREELDEIWGTSPPLAQWLEARRAAAGP